MVIGALLLLVGVVAAFLGPIEMYCFHLFSEGGRFHYEGFGFGSFMFGNIAVQIAGYYVIAVLLIPLGYGHLRARRWARTFFEALLWAWLVVGVPLMIMFLFVLLSAKDLPLAVALMVVVCLGLSYPLVPGLLIWFYRSRNVRLTFEARDPNSYWTERLPLAALVLGALFAFYAIVLHIPILFNGVFPLFGVWLTGLQGIVALTISIMCLVCLTWGIVRQSAWAWWGSLVFFGLLTISSVSTLATSSWGEMLSLLNFPPTEMEALQGIPVQGLHFAVFVGIPLLATLGAIFLSKRPFSSGSQQVQEAEERIHA
jgi:hypothetical protein